VDQPPLETNGFANGKHLRPGRPQTDDQVQMADPVKRGSKGWVNSGKHIGRCKVSKSFSSKGEKEEVGGEHYSEPFVNQNRDSLLRRR